MFGIGGFELFIILIFGFLIFGPDKLPDIARTVGKGIARFRDAQREVNEAIGDDKLIDLDNPDEPFKNPVEALDRLAKLQEEKLNAAKGASGAKAADSASDAPVDAPSEGDSKQESFTERKARYERERAARKAAEAEAAKKQESDVSEAAEASSESSADSLESATQEAEAAANAADAADTEAPADAATAPTAADDDATTSSEGGDA